MKAHETSVVLVATSSQVLYTHTAMDASKDEFGSGAPVALVTGPLASMNVKYAKQHLAARPR